MRLHVGFVVRDTKDISEVKADSAEIRGRRYFFAAWFGDICKKIVSVGPRNKGYTMVPLNTKSETRDVCFSKESITNLRRGKRERPEAQRYRLAWSTPKLGLHSAPDLQSESSRFKLDIIHYYVYRRTNCICWPQEPSDIITFLNISCYLCRLFLFQLFNFYYCCWIIKKMIFSIFSFH